MMKLFNWFKNKFLTKKFVTFGMIGLMNTLVHNAIYFSYCFIFGENEANYYLGTTISFTIATIFSYFLNSYFTFKEEKFSLQSFTKMFAVFFAKLMATLFLQYLFGKVLFLIFRNGDYEIYAAIPAQLLMIPLSFLILDKIFKNVVQKNRDKSDEISRK